MVKYGIEFECKLGILTKNPELVTEHELNCRRNLVWIKYGGYWYLNTTKLSLEETISYINDSLCKKEVVDKIMELI